MWHSQLSSCRKSVDGEDGTSSAFELTRCNIRCIMHNSAPRCGLKPCSPAVTESHLKTACSTTAKTLNCYWYHQAPFYFFFVLLRGWISHQNVRQNESRKKIIHILLFSQALLFARALFGKPLLSQKHIFQTEGETRKKLQNKRERARKRSHTDVFFKHSHTYQTQTHGHTKKHTHSVLRIVFSIDK